MSDMIDCEIHQGEECCESPGDGPDECECSCCHDTREEAKDREFDERASMGCV